MKIRSVAILGAGAVGSYLLWGLTDKPGVTVSVVAEGARADRLRRAGCTINGKAYRPQVPCAVRWMTSARLWAKIPPS